ncbi:MAG: type II toxin-antitoxin system RelE/ParE family toxin [Leptospiraceae bacterium]|nr:type II toxin-antitoxin system RelE/ParE family toxin [Leptospiraceae bacterium]MCB1199241.1 type II toxin-antitoxin system RelE/ParE family toxin [Leptospiraceae bacterium]
MILSFGDTETEKIWNQTLSKKLPKDIQPVMLRKLIIINRSQNLNDLKIPPGNKLEKMKGNLKNMYSIRINDQWRILFKWEHNNAHEVIITDYHK